MIKYYEAKIYRYCAAALNCLEELPKEQFDAEQNNMRLSLENKLDDLTSKLKEKRYLLR